MLCSRNIAWPASFSCFFAVEKKTNPENYVNFQAPSHGLCERREGTELLALHVFTTQQNSGALGTASLMFYNILNYQAREWNGRNVKLIHTEKYVDTNSYAVVVKCRWDNYSYAFVMWRKRIYLGHVWQIQKTLHYIFSFLMFWEPCIVKY